jgi:hypothetical protein
LNQVLRNFLSKHHMFVLGVAAEYECSSCQLPRTSRRALRRESKRARGTLQTLSPTSIVIHAHLRRYFRMHISSQSRVAISGDVGCSLKPTASRPSRSFDHRSFSSSTSRPRCSTTPTDNVQQPFLLCDPCQLGLCRPMPALASLRSLTLLAQLVAMGGCSKPR